MKVVVLILLSLISCSLISSEDVAGEEPIVQHGQGPIMNTGRSYGVGGQGGVTGQSNNIMQLLLLVYALPLLQDLFKPKETTAKPTDASTGTVTKTESSTESTTPDPFASWTSGVSNCVFKLFTTGVKAEQADTECKKFPGANLASAVFNDAADTDAREKIIDDAGASSNTFWVWATAKNTGGTLSVEKWKIPDTAIGGGLTFDLKAGADDGDVCGRFDGANANKLIFEECDDRKIAYMCEFCGKI